MGLERRAGKEVRGKQEELWVLDVKGRAFQEGRVPEGPGEEGTESFALATWWSLVILAKVLVLRSEGCWWKGSMSNPFEKFHWEREKNEKNQKQAMGWDRCFCFILRETRTCLNEKGSVSGKGWVYRGGETCYIVRLWREKGLGSRIQGLTSG